MQFFSSLSIYAILVFLLLCTNGTRAAIKLPRSKTIPAVIMFGDSIVDTGNNSYIETIFKVNYPPYGKDFMGGKPTGSFCDGKVPSDLLVEELGIKQLLPPYLDPTLQAKDLRAGLNFASGGAGFDPLTYELAKVISLSDQLDLYKEFLARLKELVGEDITSTIVSNSLYIVVVGSNDITNTYYNNPLQSLHFDFSSYTDLMLDSASVFAQALHNLGGRRIGLFGVSPIGCLPSQRTLAGGALRNCAENYNQLSQPFNKKLSAQLNFLNANLPQARMVYVGAFSLPLELINSPTKYDLQQDEKSGAQKYRVKRLPGSGSQTMDVLCQAIDSSIFAFWSKSSVDIDPRRNRLQSNSYTTNTILETVTAATVQLKEMRGRSWPSDSCKGIEPPTEKKKKGLGDWMNMIKPVNAEKDHWVPSRMDLVGG